MTRYGLVESYLRSGLAGLPQKRYPEITLSALLEVLLAKYDLIAVEPGQRAVIVDWKTAERRPKRERLSRPADRDLPLCAGAGGRISMVGRL
jgi:hypothetical protein